MTPKQREKIKDKIKRVKATLAAEKRKFGGYDDSRGLRYLPTELYIKLGDVDGGLRYLKWFNKNFPDDIGFPNFLFESTVILFKAGHLTQAETYALRTYFSNTLLFDKYFSRPPMSLGNEVKISFQQAHYLKNFNYRHDQDDLLEFSQ